ncbi:hypothetical protein UT300005_05080 [Clostridium sp. CTA-5]
MKEKWYEKGFATVFFLIFFCPVGLYLMWKYRSMNKLGKILITMLILTIYSTYLSSY